MGPGLAHEVWKSTCTSSEWRFFLDFVVLPKPTCTVTSLQIFVRSFCQIKELSQLFHPYTLNIYPHLKLLLYLQADTMTTGWAHPQRAATDKLF